MLLSYPKIRQMCKNHPLLIARIVNKMKKKTVRHWHQSCISNSLETGEIIIKYLIDNSIKKEIL